MNKWRVILAGVIVLSASACRIKPQSSVDGVTSATHISGEPEYPPQNNFYQVFAQYEGLNNYVVKYDEQFYRGGNIVIEDLALEALNDFGVKTIISITPSPEERIYCRENGFELVEIPFDRSGPSREDYRVFFKTLEAARAPVYVHCKGGTHRAGILGAAYRMRVQDWTFEKAIIEYGRLGGDLKADHLLIESLHTIESDQQFSQSE